MSNITRLRSGDTVVIRTGAVQGIGPQGPAGPSGSTGPEGPPGPQGEPGPIGQVAEHAVLAQQSGTPQSVAAATNTIVNFPSAVLDEMNAKKSDTNFQPGAGRFFVSVFLNFNKGTGTLSGGRIVRVLVNGQVAWGNTVNAIAATGVVDTVLSVSGGLVLTADDIVTVQVWHNDAASLSLTTAKLFISRVGPGATGPAGPQGPIGATGATGAAGPKGDPGTVGNNQTTFAQLAAGTA